MKLKDLKKGEYFKKKESAKTVYIKGDYLRSEKRYECSDFEDINRFVYIPGNKEVFTDFEF